MILFMKCALELILIAHGQQKPHEYWQSQEYHVYSSGRGVVGSRLEIYMIVTESIRGDYRERGGHMRVPSTMLS